MRKGGQGELERFRVVSRWKRGFVRSILSAFPFLREKGDFERDSGILSRFRVKWSWKWDYIPYFGKGMLGRDENAGQVVHVHHSCQSTSVVVKSNRSDFK